MACFRTELTLYSKCIILYSQIIKQLNMINKVILVGNIGKEPEVKELDNGKKVVRITLATNETYKDKEGNKQTATQWHNLVAFNYPANFFAKYLHKGDQIFIEGKLNNRSWENEDGVKKYITEVVVTEVKALKTKKEEPPLPEEMPEGFSGETPRI